MSSYKKLIRVGVIGCGELAQVAHLPVLSMLSDYYIITYLCDVSQQVLAHCSHRIGSNPLITTSVSELCSSPEVDAVLISSNTPLHTVHATVALQNNKHVFLEKPVTYSYEDLDALMAAESKSKGTIFVGYMRRYATAFTSAIEEIGDKSKIQYARIRSIIGPNSVYVQQSGIYPKRFDDVPLSAKAEVAKIDDTLKERALSEYGVVNNSESKTMLYWLGALGSHDISAMREVLGSPLSVRGAFLQPPIWSAIFEYDGFSVTYESGMNSVPDFDAHIELYANEKIVQVKYEQPYIKGLPTTMTIREKIIGRRGDVGLRRSLVRETYEDNYSVQLLEWHKSIVEKTSPKTGLDDSRKDLDIIKMLMQVGFERDKVDKA